MGCGSLGTRRPAAWRRLEAEFAASTGIEDFTDAVAEPLMPIIFCPAFHANGNAHNQKTICCRSDRAAGFDFGVLLARRTRSLFSSYFQVWMFRSSVRQP